MSHYFLDTQYTCSYFRDSVRLRQEAPLEPLNMEHFVLPYILLASGLGNVIDTQPLREAAKKSVFF